MAIVKSGEMEQGAVVRPQDAPFSSFYRQGPFAAEIVDKIFDCCTPFAFIALSQTCKFYRDIGQPGYFQFVQRLIQMETWPDYMGNPGVTKCGYSKCEGLYACTTCLKLRPRICFDQISTSSKLFRKPKFDTLWTLWTDNSTSLRDKGEIRKIGSTHWVRYMEKIYIECPRLVPPLSRRKRYPHLRKHLLSVEGGHRFRRQCIDCTLQSQCIACLNERGVNDYLLMTNGELICRSGGQGENCIRHPNIDRLRPFSIINLGKEPRCFDMDTNKNIASVRSFGVMTYHYWSRNSIPDWFSYNNNWETYSRYEQSRQGINHLLQLNDPYYSTHACLPMRVLYCEKCLRWRSNLEFGLVPAEFCGGHLPMTHMNRWQNDAQEVWCNDCKILSGHPGTMEVHYRLESLCQSLRNARRERITINIEILSRTIKKAREAIEILHEPITKEQYFQMLTGDGSHFESMEILAITEQWCQHSTLWDLFMSRMEKERMRLDGDEVNDEAISRKVSEAIFTSKDWRSLFEGWDAYKTRIYVPSWDGDPDPTLLRPAETFNQDE